MLRPRCAPILWCTALVAGLGCGGKVDRSEPAGVPQAATDSVNLATSSGSATPIRFAIEVGSDSMRTVYVLLNREDSQVGWVTVFREGERIFLRERCEIEDCGVPAAVCGAAIPLIRNIAGAGIIEVEWTGMTSVLDSITGCEMREPAAPGEYTARFCFSRDARIEGEGDPTHAAPGRLVGATCIEKEFNLRLRQVVLGI